ncbi:PAS domain S-box-containing protein [Thermodesulfobium acidiphilum]|uniref:PAS domain S-box-containing protein n=1 Tax=Thermodesulfobium acidiphilum TaxID=1794699 RepID=A0A2R4W2E5_THEAF|nr:PAS domain S-box protein [Thermodesulfobium acidiphilum]AWB10979.1 PAS domain S-box-containing protein [Thermodesulfobium acidiphilum]
MMFLRLIREILFCKKAIHCLEIFKWFLLLLFILMVLSNFRAYSQGLSSKKVLILNSYSPDYIWAVEEQKGILQELSDKSPSPQIFIENMDVKRFNTKNYFEDFSNLFIKKYRGFKFDAIIATDDPAFIFALQERGQFGNPPIFFCGVNTYSDDIKGFVPDRIYGVKEEEDLESTLSLMLKLFPNTKKILGIADANDAAYFKKQFDNFFVSHKDILNEYFVSNNLERIINKINSEPSGTLVLDLITHSIDKYGSDLIGSTPTIELSKRVNIPIFGMFDYQLGNGIVGGMITSGFDQGKIVGKLVYQYLFNNGTGWENSKIVDSSESNYYAFDENFLKKFNIKRSQLPLNSKIINHHETLFERYSKAILYFSVVAFLLLLIIVLLVVVLIQKRREFRKLSESEKYFRLLLENSSDIILVVDADGEILFENDSIAMLFSDINDIEAKNFLNFLENGERERFKLLFEKIVVTEKDSIFPFKFYISTKSGAKIVFEGKAKKVSIKEEDFILLTISEVTEKERIHNSLREREEDYDILFNNINDIVLVVDSDYRIIKSNNELYRTFGYKPEDVINKEIINFVHPEDKGYVKSLIERIQKENITSLSFEIKAVDAKNHIKILDIKTNTIYKNSKKLIFVVCRDITEKKRSEEAFIQKQRELNILLDSLPGYIYYKNKEGIYVFVNNNFSKMLGKDRKEIIGHTDYEIFGKEQAEKNLELDRMTVRLGMVHFQEEVLRKPNGESISVLTQKVPIFDENRNLQGLISLSYDITELKSAYNLVKNIEEKYFEIISLIDEVIFELDYSGRFSFISDRIYNYTNLYPKDFLNKFFVDFSSPAEKEKLTLFFMSMLKGDKKSAVFEIDIRNDKDEYIKFEMKIFAKYEGKVFKGALGSLRKI